MKKLKDYSEWEIQQYAKSLQKIIVKGFIDDGWHTPIDHTKKASHDTVSVYNYGNKEVKIVYNKFDRKAPSKNASKIKEVSDLSDTSSFEKTRFDNSISRTRSRIFELAICNEFQYFCTFTLDKMKRDRNDLPTFIKTLTQFIRNENRGREVKIKYVLIPEQHKKGGWHLHGLIQGLTDDDLRLFRKDEYIPKRLLDKIEKGEKIYNFVKYSQKFGYCTLTTVKNAEACSRYITKYITKDLQSAVLQSGAHLFYSSNGLKGRETLAKNSLGFPSDFEWDYENEYVKIATVPYNEGSLDWLKNLS